MAVASNIEDLDKRFGITGAARVLEGNGGLPKVVINNSGATGEIYLHGAHVTSWVPTGQEEVLFVSQHSLYEDGRAIRGGIPICFPWFGDRAGYPGSPAHGFVRTKSWQLESIEQAEDSVVVSLVTESDPQTLSAWPASFRLICRASFGAVLSVELNTTNTGTTPLSFEEALHAYFKVADVENIRIKGLDGVLYLDKTDQDRPKMQAGDIVISSETDRVYVDTQGSIELEDRGANRRIEVKKSHSSDTVVWNPWIQKAKALGDLGNDEWKNMVCIEGSNAGDAAVNLAPGAQHAMQVSVRVFRMI